MIRLRCNKYSQIFWQQHPKSRGVLLPVVVRTDEPQYWYVNASVQGLGQCLQPKLAPPRLSKNRKVLLSCT